MLSEMIIVLRARFKRNHTVFVSYRIDWKGKKEREEKR